MTLDTKIIDGSGNKKSAIVTKYGQLVTAPLEYDLVENATMDAADTAFNLFKPKVGQQFVITNILITAKKNVTGDEVVDVYEATAINSTVIDKSIIQIEMLKSAVRDFIGLNLLISEGKFINAKADDADTLMTIMGYYIPKIVRR